MYYFIYLSSMTFWTVSITVQCCTFICDLQIIEKKLIFHVLISKKRGWGYKKMEDRREMEGYRELR